MTELPSSSPTAFSTIVNADLICVVQAGEILEQGQHDDLLELHGVYHELYERQFVSDDADEIL